MPPFGPQSSVVFKPGVVMLHSKFILIELQPRLLLTFLSVINDLCDILERGRHDSNAKYEH